MIKKELYKQPYICYYHQVFDDDECDFVINESEKLGKYERSMIYNTQKKMSEVADMRTSSSFEDESNQFHEIRTKAYELIKQNLPHITINHMEKAQIQRYEDSQFVGSHMDFFNVYGKKVNNNDKMATLIVYLNDNFEGGETLFNCLGIKVKPKKGSALFFQYNYSEYINNISKHEGLPVMNGTKYIVTFWVREKANGA
jgi:prolyl 4-hydroxylase